MATMQKDIRQEIDRIGVAPESPDAIQKYLDEEWQITLTRRQVYWLRKQSRKRLESAMQGMNAVGASPAKHSARREEYYFHQALLDRLMGVETEPEELEALRQAENARQAAEMAERAKKLKEQADRLMENARRLTSETA